MRHPLAFQIALLLTALPPTLTAVAATPSAQAAPAIAPASLDTALEQFAQTSGLQLIYDPALTAHLRSPGAPAGLAPLAQLQRLLGGTGLAARQLTATSLSIAPAAPTSAPAPPSAAKAAPAEASADRSAARDLAPVTVVANQVDTLAPSAPPLDAIQPTSVIDERFIRDGLRFNANYDDIIKYAPSVSVTSPEGPGMGKNEGISIRGFQDGQFNITFDGIPFGDASDLHHTTSAYFNNHILGQAEIDRGPGGGATIGNATFGGTVGLRSRDPGTVDGVTAYSTVGSWNTVAGGVSVEQHLGSGTRLLVDLSKEHSDTYLDGTDDRREHAFIKTISDVGEASTLTFVTSYNQEHQNTVQGATKAQIAANGWRTGLGEDPALQNYTGYNDAAYYSSFSYLALLTQWGGWDVDNRVYANTFDHRADKTTEPTSDSLKDNGVTFYNAAGKKIGKAAIDVPGKRADNDNLAFGDVLRLARDLGPGELKTGVWLERALDHRYQTPLDMSTGMPTGTKYGNADNYRLKDRTDTAQPYVEYAWRLSDALTLSPGLRYADVARRLSAEVNKSTPPLPSYTRASYDAWLPSLSLHDAIDDHWSAYAQVARGFLAPPIDVIELNGARGLDPELTTNMQLGTGYADRGLTFGVDVYHIDFSNFISQTRVATSSGTEQAFVNGGGAVYRGIESEATVALSPTVSVYGNASYNEATYKGSSVQVAAAPHVTATLGMLYNSGTGWYGSLMDKFIGARYGVDNRTDASGATVFGNDERLPSYTSLDAAGGYRSTHGPWNLKGYSLSLAINNLLDTHRLIGYAGTRSTDNAPLYFGLAGRGVFLDLSATF
ncbi:TonB-dependent receptor [Xanthomonas prunicola]|uniref:TonB-dependent receptor domain-containing protein n=1 Tax=Xanthomonas prunicola TaxID=2053930 RepID=UPI0021B4244F|nr:TonB-dependent receptor [Xanthomonas prunicola]UXA51792.1 TonB-dependent receptor [Xanthomonas prunicola]